MEQKQKEGRNRRLGKVEDKKKENRKTRKVNGRKVQIDTENEKKKVGGIGE